MVSSSRQLALRKFLERAKSKLQSGEALPIKRPKFGLSTVPPKLSAILPSKPPAILTAVKTPDSKLAPLADRLGKFPTPQAALINSLIDLDLFPGVQSYCKSVAASIDVNFRNDSEVNEIWRDLTWQDVVYTVVSVAKYREDRRREGRMHSPPAVQLEPGQSPISASDVLDWAFFAHAAYTDNDDALRKLLLTRNHQLISHEPHAGVFSPSHFLSMSLNEGENLIVIGIKGTSSINDWLTNLFIAKEELRVSSSSNNSRTAEGQDFGIHAGVLQAARFVLERVGVILQKAFYKAGFSIVVVGHSLGGGVATALAMLLREELNMERVHCYAFAPPPAVSRHLAELSKPYINSIVNGDDVIPRTGVAQLKNLVIGIRNVTNVRNEHNGDWEKVQALMDSLEWGKLVETYARGLVEKKFDTYVPGRILYLHDQYLMDDDTSGSGVAVSRAVEVACNLYVLRVTTLSTTMLTDHLMSSHIARLQRIIKDEK